ncbi:hypothetical protein GTA08_BOTSDO10769 [Botryosphaeria dothidea]|uniref:Uncharacterized protein n=1 Tax=Botryosphaeria dothidea TaxID=55169 RepID=A0A8H4II88_9PEZI|nr:hypothetical protein GTA08_BOTSDO10769 [Botryosphaeria dothidea]
MVPLRQYVACAAAVAVIGVQAQNGTITWSFGTPIPSTATRTASENATAIANNTLAWLPSDVAVHSFLALRSCDAEWGAYSSSHRETYTTSYVITWSYPTAVTKDSPVITLCDGIPRGGPYASQSLVTTVTTSTVRSTYVNTSGTAAPTCSLGSRDCSSLWSLWSRHKSTFSQTRTASNAAFSKDPTYWTPTCTQEYSCEEMCVFGGMEAVELYYWPEPWLEDLICPNATRTTPPDKRQTAFPVIATVGNMTMTSPTAYLHFSRLYARDIMLTRTCGQDMTSVWVPVPPKEISSMPDGGIYHAPTDSAKPFNFANLAKTTVSGVEIALVQSSAYWWPNSCKDNLRSIKNTCAPATIRNDYRPNLLPLRGAFGTHFMHDPPIPLTSAAFLVEPSSKVTVDQPVKTSKPAEPSKPVTEHLPTSTSPPRTTDAVKPTDAPPQQPSSAQSDPADPVNTGIPDPGSSPPESSNPGDTGPGNSGPGSSNPGGSDPGGSNSGNSDPEGSGSGSSNPGSSGPGGSDPGSSKPGNSGPSAPSDPSDLSSDDDDSNNNNLPATVIIALPASSISKGGEGGGGRGREPTVITAGGSTYTAIPDVGLDLGTTTVRPGEPGWVTVGNEAVSVGTGGAVVVADGEQTGVYGGEPSSAVVTVGGEVVSMGVHGVVVGGSMIDWQEGAATGVILSVGGDAATIEGHAVSLAPSGVVVVDGYSRAYSGISGAVVTAGDHTFTIAGVAEGVASMSAETVLTIGSLTLTASSGCYHWRRGIERGSRRYCPGWFHDIGIGTEQDYCRNCGKQHQVKH